MDFNATREMVTERVSWLDVIIFAFQNCQIPLVDSLADMIQICVNCDLQ